jgi:hypothetical protein
LPSCELHSHTFRNVSWGDSSKPLTAVAKWARRQTGDQQQVVQHDECLAPERALKSWKAPISRIMAGRDPPPAAAIG